MITIVGKMLTAYGSGPSDVHCRPGDYVVWKGEGQERPVVVQKVNPAERTAMVLFTDTNSTELVSLLELDPHGSTDPELFGTPDEYGVGQGDIVFIHPEGQTNGHVPPHVPRLGVLEPWATEAPVYDEHASNLGWRKEMCTIGSSLVTPRKITPPALMKDSQESKGSLNWLGHVTSVSLLNPYFKTFASTYNVVIATFRWQRRGYAS